MSTGRSSIERDGTGHRAENKKRFAFLIATPDVFSYIAPGSVRLTKTLSTKFHKQRRSYQ